MKWADKKQTDHSFEAFLAGDDYKYVLLKEKFFDSICLNCTHILSLNDETCEAFPDGIPRKFWEGKEEHTVAADGDNGITFEPKG